MKDYKRLTEQNTKLSRKGEWKIQKTKDCQICSVFSDGDTYYVGKPIDKLAYYENKIESGELCDREEVRKETAREILQMLVGHEIRDKEAHMSWVIVKQDVTFIAEKYGIDLFGETEQVGNSDKLEER